VRGIKNMGAFDLYCTVASQVYNGYDGEAASTNLAVSVTAGIVPTYAGTPIVAYFSSTSGGHTENIENVWGGSPVPYLKGVARPVRHGLALPHLARRAATLVGGHGRAKLGVYRSRRHAAHDLRGERGVSPRVVRAYVLGTDGSSEHLASAASGWTLRNKLSCATRGSQCAR
jgi:stage II sporulation protein D